jgi:aspartate aminotransferase
MWTEVVENIRLAGGVPVPVALSPDKNYRYDPAEIEKKINSKTKAIFLNTPHNPSGAVISKEDLVKIAEMGQKNKLWVVSDEAYEDVIFAPNTHTSIASLIPESYKEVVSIYSFSKSHAMSGLRVGYIASKNPLLKDRLPKLLRCTINGVNSLAQWTALSAVSSGRDYLNYMNSQYEKRRDKLFAALDGIPGLKPFKAQGTFFLWCEVEDSLLQKLGCKNVDEISTRLAEQGLGSSPGDAFGDSCDKAIRFAFSCSDKMIEEGAPLLRRFFLGSD